MRPGPQRADWPELLDEMEAVVRQVARGGPQNRHDASVYLETRAALLASQVAGLLPGFLMQCHSILRLREFLTLYDPEPELRERFMVRAMTRCREAAAEHTGRRARGGRAP